jgi:hypothetical protein
MVAKRRFAHSLKEWMGIMKINKAKTIQDCVGARFVRSTYLAAVSGCLGAIISEAVVLAQVGAPPPGGIEPPPVTKNEIAVSGDYLHGYGNVTLPIGFTFASKPVVGTPDRDTDFAGVTVSYSYGQAFYADLSYAHGRSEGNFDIPNIIGPSKSTTFTITEDSYQLFGRYTFPALQGTRFSAYLRAGVSYIPAELKDVSDAPGVYQQRDEIDDVLGNVGFGLSYSVYSAKRSKVILNLEGEGFYGHRWQDSEEKVFGARTTKSFENDLYGAIGRATVRFQYGFGRSGLLKFFADAGMAVKHTTIDYSEFHFGNEYELLWGPYVKTGLRYQF